jgi:hypothetical protein
MVGDPLFGSIETYLTESDAEVSQKADHLVVAILRCASATRRLIFIPQRYRDAENLI